MFPLFSFIKLFLLGGGDLRQPFFDSVVIESQQQFGSPIRYFPLSQPPYGCHGDANISLTSCLVLLGESMLRMQRLCRLFQLQNRHRQQTFTVLFMLYLVSAYTVVFKGTFASCRCGKYNLDFAHNADNVVLPWLPSNLVDFQSDHLEIAGCSKMLLQFILLKIDPKMSFHLLFGAIV